MTDHIVTTTTTPTAVADNGFTVEEYGSLSIPAETLLANDTDPEGDPLMIVSVGEAVNGWVFLEADGSVRFTPFPDALGPASFSYTITDPSGATSTETVSLDITPLAGTTRIEGTAGNDRLVAGTGDHVLVGHGGDDELVSGAGADVLSGGEGIDTADYGASTAGVTVDLELGTASGGYAEGDRLVGIENLAGSAHADTLVGDEQNNVLTGGAGKDRLTGGAGDDVLDGGAGSDVLDGGAGWDAVSYASATSGVRADLGAGRGRSGDAKGDSFISIEELRGSAHADILIGDAGANVLRGGGGADRLEGGAGSDTADYSSSATGVTVSLATGTGSGGEAQGDVLIDIENLVGSAHADRLTGDAGANQLEGGAGADILSGGAGSDTYVYTAGDGADVIDDQGQLTDQDELVLRGIDPATVRLVERGTDLVVLAEGQPELLVAGHFATDANGLDAIRFDGGAVWNRAELHSRSRNNAPEPVADSVATDEDTALVIPAADLLANDTDIDGDVLIIVSVQDAANGTVTLDASGDVVFTPAADYHGPASFTYTVSDGTATATASVDITVRPVNDAPAVGVLLADQSSPEDMALSFALPAGAFTDIDGDALTLSATQSNGTALPTWLSFDATTGTFSGTPPQDWNGSLGVTVTASDGALMASQSFTLTVTPVNDAPIVDVPIGNRSVPEDHTIYIPLASAFQDIDGDALNLSATLSTGDPLPTWLQYDVLNKSLSGTPPKDWNGALDINVTASDGVLTANQTFTLTVTPVNDAPIAVADSGFTVEEFSSLSIAPSALLANDNDPDGDLLSIVSIGWGTNGDITRLSDGTIVFTPYLDFLGPGGFSYTIADPSGATSTAYVDIDVVPIPGATRIVGTAGDDRLVAGTGDHVLIGGDGEDVLVSGAGNDVLSGGGWFDTADYSASTAGVNADLESNILSGGYADGDRLFDITNLNGSAYADTLTGDGNDNVIKGGAGVDVLDGGLSVDILEGGAGADTLDGGGVFAEGGGSLPRGFMDYASYEDSSTGVMVDITLGTGQGGDAEGDTLFRIDGLIGSSFNDTLIGNAADNELRGGAGNDILRGGAGDDVFVGAAGSDVMDGGDGWDQVLYWESRAGISIDLSTGIATGGDAEGDTFTSIEMIEGTDFSDTLIGDAGDNSFYGGGGDDLLQGGAGNDLLGGDWGNDTFLFVVGVDSGLDTIEYFTAGAASEDVITFQGYAHLNTFDDVLAVAYADGWDTRIDVDATTSITLWGTQLADLHADDFKFVA